MSDMKFYKGLRVMSPSVKIVCTLTNFTNGVWQYISNHGTEKISEKELRHLLKEKRIVLIENGIQRMKRRHNL